MSFNNFIENILCLMQLNILLMYILLMPAWLSVVVLVLAWNFKMLCILLFC